MFKRNTPKHVVYQSYIFAGWAIILFSFIVFITYNYNTSKIFKIERDLLDIEMTQAISEDSNEKTSAEWKLKYERLDKQESKEGQTSWFSLITGFSFGVAIAMFASNYAESDTEKTKRKMTKVNKKLEMTEKEKKKLEKERKKLMEELEKLNPPADTSKKAIESSSSDPITK